MQQWFGYLTNWRRTYIQLCLNQRVGHLLEELHQGGGGGQQDGQARSLDHSQALVCKSQSMDGYSRVGGCGCNSYAVDWTMRRRWSARASLRTAIPALADAGAIPMSPGVRLVPALADAGAMAPRDEGALVPKSAVGPGYRWRRRVHWTKVRWYSSRSCPRTRVHWYPSRPLGQCPTTKFATFGPVPNIEFSRFAVGNLSFQNRHVKFGPCPIVELTAKYVGPENPSVGHTKVGNAIRYSTDLLRLGYGYPTDRLRLCLQLFCSSSTRRLYSCSTAL
jgi:hypothetical protein